MNQLIIVSNRVPDVSGARAGGLAVALRAVLKRTGGVWFGWNGKTLAETDTTPVLTDMDNFQMVTIGLSQEDVDEYYHGAGNRILWPLFHNRADLMRIHSRYYDAYCRVNARFAHCLADMVEPDDNIWVQDFHLFPLGRELRRMGVAGNIGFFLHIPFPPPGILTALPWAEEIARWLGAYDLVGFQTWRDLTNFHEYVIRELDGRVNGDVCSFDGHECRTGVFPVSINSNGWLKLVGSRDFEKQVEKVRGEIQPPPFAMIGVERLDYTKGLLQRVLAFEQLLVHHERFREEACLYQVVAPSRGDVPEYANLKDRLDLVTGRINSSYAAFDWVPVRYLHRTFSQTELAAFYRICQVGVVSSLLDGMNLVAKEYVVAQDPNDPGVLVLSRFAGAAEEFSEGALLVNPYDIEGLAENMRIAFDMKRSERRERWESMIKCLKSHDIHDWAGSFVNALQHDEAPARTTGGRGA